MLRSYKVVIEEVRARHPELPARLFRWADGHNTWSSGSRTWPVGSGQPARHCFSKRWSKILVPPSDKGRGGFLRASGGQAIWCARKSEAPWRRGDTVVNRNFFEVDPTILCGRPRAPWNRKRLADAAALFVERRADVPSGANHRSPEDVGADIRQI